MVQQLEKGVVNAFGCPAVPGAFSMLPADRAVPTVRSAPLQLAPAKSEPLNSAPAANVQGVKPEGQHPHFTSAKR